MNSRLQEIIKYKTGGHQTAFANLLGWTPQYLAKLLKGDNFGLQPVLSILETLPEINARWFLLGKGSMLEIGKLFDLQREALSHIQELLDLDKYIPYMDAEEIHEFEEAVKTGRKPVYSPDTLLKWKGQLSERENDLNAKFAAATNKSDAICKQKIAKK
ncbi:hypothetical protein [Bacteroides sp.]|uniref:hypothetical protein n=1 Tax=Bacteroides sp. TaxID=29523 RepID=UPI002A80E563|nr:hypothetical protein [Bacteroides sp.]